MDEYSRGRAYADKGRAGQAAASFAKGLAHGDSRCAYGLFALKMASGDRAEAEWNALLDALADIRSLAEQQDAEACFILGRCYETGCGGEQDLQKALAWYKKSAVLGCMDAVFNLGCMYCYAEQVQHVEKGMRYFMCAAADNHKEAQFNLAHMYELQGKRERAAYWFRRARRGGTAEMKEKYLQYISGE